MSEIPRGWTLTTLGTVRAGRGQSIDPSSFPTEQFELYSVPAHPTGRPELLRGSEIGSTKQLVLPGTVLLGKINPRINRVWVVPNSKSGRLIASTEWIAFAPSEKVNPRYLAHYLRQNDVRGYLAHNVSGVGGSLMRVRPAVVDPFPLLLAPLDDQDRIASCIDSYLSRLDATVVTLEQVQRNLKRYRASVLTAAVEGRLVPTEAALARAEGRTYEPASDLLSRNLAERRAQWELAEKKGTYREPVAPDTSTLPSLPQGWCWGTIEQLTRGDRASAYGVLVPGDDVESGVLMVRVGDIRDGKVYCESLKRIDSRIAARCPRTVLEGGEVLLSLVGTIGRTAIVPKELRGANVARAVGVLPILTAELPSWVELWLRGPAQNLRLSAAAHEVARKTLNLEDVRSFAVAIPPRDEQGRIIAEVSRRLTIADAAESSVARDLARIAGLRSVILRAAFRGQLV